MPPSKEDKAFVKKLVSGDRKSFEEIYYRYSRDLFYYVSSLVKEQFIAEEIIQEIFINLWVKRDTLNPNLSLKSYLYKIATNKVYDHLRAKATRQIVARDLGALTPISENKTEDALVLKEYKNIINHLIKKLTPEQQIIFQMIQQGVSPERIGKRLNLSPKTVLNNKSIINKLLKAQLSRYLEVCILLPLIDPPL